MKNTRIDCDKDTYNVLKESFVKPLNDEIEIIMNEDIFLLWNEDKKLTVKYSKSEDINESSFRCVNKDAHVF